LCILYRFGTKGYIKPGNAGEGKWGKKEIFYTHLSQAGGFVVFPKANALLKGAGL